MVPKEFFQRRTSFVWVSPEAVVWRCSVEKLFLEISQNSQENTCVRVSFRPKPYTPPFFTTFKLQVFAVDQVCNISNKYQPPINLAKYKYFCV